MKSPNPPKIMQHTTGITARRFLPNLQTVRCREGGTVLTKRVCTGCLKAGKIVKA